MKEQRIKNAYKFMTYFGLKEGHYYLLKKFTGQVIDSPHLYYEIYKTYFFNFTKDGVVYNKDNNSIYINNAFTRNEEKRCIENSKVSINDNLFSSRNGKAIINYCFEEISAEDFSNLKNGQPKTRKMFYIG